jgi:YbbR domain-containing protein
VEEMMLDQLLRSRWFVKIISFLLALLLFMGISIDTPPNSPGNNPLIKFFSSEKDPQSLEATELVAYYDEEKYVVTGLPSEVNVVLEGSESLIKKAQIELNQQIYVDLRGLKVGTHKVKVKQSGFNKNLKVTTDPEAITITIHEKVRKLVPVDIQVINEKKILPGFAYGTPIVTPNSVYVTGAKNQINKIAIIKGYVSVAFANRTIETSVPIDIFDQYGNKIENLEYPPVIDVKVPITSPYSAVRVKIQDIIGLPKGYSVVSYTVHPSNVFIYGQEDKIEKYEFIDGMIIDLEDKLKKVTNFTQPIEVEVNVPKPDDISKVAPGKVKVKIKLEKQQSKAFTNVPIELKGLSDRLTYSVVTPKEGKIDLQLLGAQSVIENVTLSEIKTYVDLSQLSVGEYEVDIEFNGPQHVDWQSDIVKVTVKITEK